MSDETRCPCGAVIGPDGLHQSLCTCGQGPQSFMSEEDGVATFEFGVLALATVRIEVAPGESRESQEARARHAMRETLRNLRKRGEVPGTFTAIRVVSA